MKTRPTDAEFDELKRVRDENIAVIVAEAWKKLGGDPNEKPHYHVSGAGMCYCACPDGPCQHIWDGPEEIETDSDDRPCGSSVTCSRCGTPAVYHDIRVMP